MMTDHSGEVDDSEDVDLKTFVSWQLFALRGALTPIKAYGPFLKAYLEVRQEIDSPLKITTPMDMEITPQLAVQMMSNILNNIERIENIHDELLKRTSNSWQE